MIPTCKGQPSPVWYCTTIAIAIALGGLIGPAKGATLPPVVPSRAEPQPARAPIRPQTTCPDNIETLSPLLLRDLPSYANRVSQRAFDLHPRANQPGYVLVAGQSELIPLSLGPGEQSTTTAETGLEQLFFTTLNRQYLRGQAVQIQHYNWLFLARTTSGWRLAMMVSRLGSYPSQDPPSPPRDSSQGVLAEAIRLWLRDCRTGNIYPLD